MEDNAIGEINFQTKSQSIRDKMKRRREAIQNLHALATSGRPLEDTAIPTSSSSTSTKPTAASMPAVSEAKKQKTSDKSSAEVKISTSTPVAVAVSTTVVEKTEKKKIAVEKKRDLDELNALLSMQSAKEREERSQQEEILTLLSKPTAKELSLMDTFRSQNGGGVKEFCSYSTKKECMKVYRSREPCSKLHFVKILQAHTDQSLGDCSFLNTCFHMDTCKYIHYEVDKADICKKMKKGGGDGSDVVVTGGGGSRSRMLESTTKLVPAQWIQCDLRNFKFEVLGKFSVIMADPPWDIHMELPYGTMSDDEMRQLPVPDLQDEGLIFLWVTGRAMELGRECLKLWGYERVDEIIWVKTNQLQRIIRTGRTGHWLNHGKEHCLVGAKGNLPINRGLDCDVIVAEVRATSHKPDEIYGIIERLSPGTRKIELFGRPHNVQPNWVTLGNQLDGVVLHAEEMLDRWNRVYPDGYNITENFFLHPKTE